MKNFIRKVIVSDDEAILEHILYNGILWVGFLGALCMTIMNFIFEQYFAMFFTSLWAASLFILFCL